MAQKKDLADLVPHQIGVDFSRGMNISEAAAVAANQCGRSDGTTFGREKMLISDARGRTRSGPTYFGRSIFLHLLGMRSKQREPKRTSAV